MRLLRERECETGNLVIEDRRRDGERGLVDEHAVERALAPLLGEKAGRGAKRGRDDDVGPRFVTDDHQRVVLGEVPRVAGEPSAHASEEILGAMDVQDGIARQEQAQQVIETHEVVHVSVGNERVRDLQHVTGLHPSQPAEIELQRTPLPAQADEQARIPEGAVHEAWKQSGLQKKLPSSSQLKIHRSCGRVNRSACGEPGPTVRRVTSARSTTMPSLGAWRASRKKLVADKPGASPARSGHRRDF